MSRLGLWWRARRRQAFAGMRPAEPLPPSDAPGVPASSVTLAIVNGVATVSIAGELDLDVEGAVVRLATKAAARRGVTLVRLDLRDVTFIDSSGIRALLVARRSLKERGAPAEFIGPLKPFARRVLEVAGIEAILGIAGGPPVL